MFRKIDNISDLRLKCQERPEKVNLKLSKYLYNISIYITNIFKIKYISQSDYFIFNYNNIYWVSFFIIRRYN